MIRRAVNSRSFPYIWLWIFTLISIRTAVCETPSNKQVKIQTINYNWVDEEKAEVTACLESEADGTPFGQLDLLVTNDLGRAWRARGGGEGGGASRKTEEAFCFAGLSLEKKDLAKTLRFRVLETGRDDPVQELETFVVVPEVTPASEGAYEICWEDPEGLAFALAEGGVARPLVAPSAGCHECCLAVAPKNPGDLVTLETAGTKDLRQLVQIRLPVDLAGGQMKPHAARVPLAIKELRKVPREDDPSGKSQNMRVVLDPHDAKDADDFQLSLTLASGAGQETYFLYKIIDEDATEIEFAGNFKDSIVVIINAMKDGDNVGFGSVAQNLTDPGSRVAKVGDASAPSLRVDPGARGQVEVPGKPPCVGGSGPCYYVGQSDPPPPLCEDLPRIRFCDAVVSELQNPAEVPTLELRNRQELRVQQPRPDGAWTEVVVSSSRDDSILPPDGFGCDELNDGTCAHPVAVADDLDGFDVTLVVLDDEGYVTASLAVPFEVHGVAALSLSQDVLQVAVDPRSGGAYEVTLAGPSPPPAATLECQAGSPCRVWFAGVDAPPAVTVRKGSNAIYEATSGSPPPASRVERLTSRDADARMDVEVASDQPVTRADLLTFKNDVATDADCESLAATPSKSGYSVAASSRGAGDWNFLVVGYDDDGALLEAGRAHVTLSDILLPRMTKVGTEALQSLKVETGEMDVKVNGFLCSASTVCYYLEPENILEPPEVCRMAAPNIEQCDMTAAYVQPESLINPLVQLSFSGAPEEDLMITAEFPETSLTMEAKLYTNSEVLTPNPLTCEITGRSPKTCTFKVEPKDTEFKILLMALDSESTVDESTVVEFEDFQTRIQQLTSDAIEVRWRASHNQKYDVEIAPEIEGKFSNTSVICGGEKPEDSKMCLAYFIGLNLNEDYTAGVRAQGDRESVSASVKVETVLETINITELTLTTTGETRGLTVCFMESREERKQNEEGNIVNKLVAVDANGRQVQMVSKSSHSSVSDVEEKLCLGPLHLDLDFDLSNKVWILVSRENLDTQETLSGGAELFLLDLNDVSQVGAKTLRATWTNRNGAPSFEVGMGVGDFMSVECGIGEDVKEECLRYLHAEGTSKQVTVTLREIGLSVQQEVQVTFTLKELTDIRITKTELNRDSRLRVCFESDLKDSLYLLALENEEGDVQEFPQLHPYLEDGLTCVLSNDAIQEEGYVALRTLLTAYDVSGTEVQASGSTNVTGIFLNPRSKVSAALNSDTHGLLVSWFLLGDPSSISSYDVALEETAAGGSNKPVTVGNTESSLVFSDTTPGRYSVCVAASVEEHHMTSGRVCSAILSIPQEDVVVPNIAETSLKSSGPKKVLVTWQKPQEDADVSSYVITWSSSSPVSSSPSSPSSSTTPGLANLPVLHPLGLIQRARPLGDDVQDLSFVVLPAATTSVEVEDLEASQNYEMCVSSVKSDVMGTPTCSEVNQGDYQPLDSPKNLTHEDEVLRWADVPGAASYLVEWQADYEGELSEGGLEEVNGTSWPTQDLPPGAWVVEVRAVSDTSASETASITIRKAGIVVGQPTQTNNSHLEISWWEEPVPSCHQPPYEYSITLLIDGREEKYNHSCSGCRGDCTKLLDVEGAKESVVVKVERDTKSIQVELRVYVFKAVPELRQRFSSGGEEVALSWAPTEDARLYNVTLFADADLVSVRKAETISREAYTLKGSDLVGNVFQVQPCADVHTCGDSQRIRLQEPPDPAPEYDLIIIIVSVVGGVVVVSIIGSLVAVFMKKKKTKKEMENLRRQKEPPVPLSDYDGWGEVRLDVRAQLRPQVPVYDEWGSRRLGQGPQPLRQ